MDIREEFSHCDRYCGVCTDLLEVIKLLRRECIFQEEEPVLFSCKHAQVTRSFPITHPNIGVGMHAPVLPLGLGELHSLSIVQTLVRVVAELDLITESRTRVAVAFTIPTRYREA